MSDYVHRKAVRLPFNPDWGDPEEFENTMPSDLVDTKNGFSVGYTKLNCYIDWNYFYSYGENSGDFGYSRKLTNKELKVIKPYFDKLGIGYNKEDFRLVDYCYYNCSDPSDCYELTDKDQSHLLIKKK